jgi:hypothetical protein
VHRSQLQCCREHAPNCHPRYYNSALENKNLFNTPACNLHDNYVSLLFDNEADKIRPKGSEDGLLHSESVGLWTMSIVRNSKWLEKKTMFRKLDLFPFSGDWGDWRWLRLALPKGSNILDVSFPSPEDGNRFGFRNIVISSHLVFLTIDKVHKLSESVGKTSIVFIAWYFWNRASSFITVEFWFQFR